MKILSLKPVIATPKILSSLEKRGLIRTLKPTRKTLITTREKGIAEKIYSSAPRFGSHKLICVRLNNTERFKLNSHSDNEEFMIINATNLKFKPLYLVIGLLKHKLLDGKIKKNRLSTKDIIALKMQYNTPKTSIFTMLKGTPHCEITARGKGIGPIFFVTEPTKMKTTRFKIKNYKFSIQGLK